MQLLKVTQITVQQLDTTMNYHKKEQLKLNPNFAIVK